MPLRANNGVEYPGAGVNVYPPCESDCCCAYPSVQQLAKYYNENGQGAVIKGGVARLNDDLAGVGVACEGVASVITSYNWFILTLYGSGFGSKTGLARLDVDIGAGWVERGTGLWVNAQVQHNAPFLPIGSKARIRTSCGAFSNEFTIVALLDVDGKPVTSWPWPVPVPGMV